MIRTLRLTNWMCYRGTHVLELGPMAYGVHARDVADADRSNWNGKSACLEAVDFALHGRLNPDRHFDKDGWITRGEKYGEVHLIAATPSGPLAITRGRKVGGSEQLVVLEPGAQSALMKDRAEECIRRRVTGLAPDDFLHAFYFRQRQMAEFILARPEPRMEVVGAWLRLGPLQEGEELLRSEVSGLAREAESLDAELAACAEQLEGLDEEGPSLQALADADQAEHHARLEWEENERARKLHEADREFLRLDQEGPALRAELDALRAGLPTHSSLSAMEERHRALTEQAGVEYRNLQQKEALSRGQFDGRCPVAGMECPAAATVRGMRAEGARLAAESRARLETLKAGVEEDRRVLRGVESRIQAAERLTGRLDAMRARATELLPSHEAAARCGPPQDAPVLWARLRAAADEKARLEAARAAAEARKKRAEQLRVTAEEKAGRLKEVRRRLQARREALAIFGRQGAQRVLAEGALEDIQAGANDVLARAGVALTVSVRWGREGKDPAKACGDCGAAFPPRSGPTCPRCGAARGKNIVQRLDVLLSDQSGAAEDLAGVAFRLAAAHWLRAQRGALWQAALIDEPFAQLDRAHSAALSRGLAEALRGSRGFGQAIVVAHDQQVLSALPGRIEVVREGKDSKVRVA